MAAPVFFGDVVVRAAEIVSRASLPATLRNPLLIRDVYGLVSIALNIKRSEHQEVISKLETQIKTLGVYAASPGVICADDLFDPDQVFSDPSAVQFVVPRHRAIGAHTGATGHGPGLVVRRRRG